MAIGLKCSDGSHFAPWRVREGASPIAYDIGIVKAIWSSGFINSSNGYNAGKSNTSILFYPYDSLIPGSAVTISNTETEYNHPAVEFENYNGGKFLFSLNIQPATWQFQQGSPETGYIKTIHPNGTVINNGAMAPSSWSGTNHYGIICTQLIERTVPITEEKLYDATLTQFINLDLTMLYEVEVLTAAGTSAKYSKTYYISYSPINESVANSLAGSTTLNNGEKVPNIKNPILIGQGFVAAPFAATYDVLASKFSDVDPYIPSNSPDPYGQGGTSGTGGGNGSYDDSSDNQLEQGASYNSASLGLYATYACDAGTIAAIGSALYADNFLEALNLGLLKVLFNSPIDALIQLMAFPFDVPASYSGNVKFGSVELKVSEGGQSRAISAPIVSNSNIYIDWGTVNIQEYWGSFLDYSPQTKIDLHLPWGAGHVQIDPAEVMNHGLRVTSLIDITKGQCVHAVYGRTNIGTFSCQCGQQLPITALDTSGKALGIATSAIAIAATAGFSGAAQSAGISAANSATAPLGASIAERAAIQREAIARAEAPYQARQRNAGRVAVASAVAAARVPVQFPRNGSFGMGSAHLDIQKPYVVISRPVQNYPTAYGNHYGYPCNMYLPLGSLSGYTEVGEVHLDGLYCTAEEKDELDKLLKGGIIL